MDRFRLIIFTFIGFFIQNEIALAAHIPCEDRLFSFENGHVTIFVAGNPAAAPFKTSKGDVILIGPLLNGGYEFQAAIQQGLAQFNNQARLVPVTQRTDLGQKARFIRDWFPSLMRLNGKNVFVQFKYQVPELFPLLAEIESKIAEARIPVIKIDLDLEHGNFIPTDDGHVFISMSSAVKTLNPGKTIAQIGLEIHKKLGLKAVFLEPNPLESTGHVDTYLVYLGGKRVAIANSANPTIQGAMDRNAQRLTSLGWHVSRIKSGGSDSPSHSSGHRVDEHYSYTNILRLGDTVLVPQYAAHFSKAQRIDLLGLDGKYTKVRGKIIYFNEDTGSSSEVNDLHSDEVWVGELSQIRSDDAAALNFYRSQGVVAIGVDMTSKLLEDGGMIHCGTTSVPAEIARQIGY